MNELNNNALFSYVLYDKDAQLSKKKIPLPLNMRGH